MTVELYSKFCIDLYQKREFHKILQMVDFLIAGHICTHAHYSHTLMLIQLKDVPSLLSLTVERWAILTAREY